MMVLVRADASVEIGMGHRVRCQALMSAFEKQGWQCQFVVQRQCKAFANEADLIIDHESAFFSMAKQVDLVILDHYAYQAQDIAELYQHQPNLLVLDDMNDRGTFPAKWLLNPLQEDYSKQIQRPLIGSQYTLLRDEFIHAVKSPSADKLLITMGGTDPLGLTLPIVEHLMAAGFAAQNIVVLMGANAKQAKQVRQLCLQHGISFHQGLREVSVVMKDAKLAISAAGSTLYELACLGVPAIFAQIADNQTRSLEQHLPLNWCRSIRFDHLSKDQLSTQISQLVVMALEAWENSDWLEKASLTAQHLVDGKGAERVVAEVMRHD
ncbi:UDP-2,4-diacetamido-2,4,6-trideoxy-beta-L-altropyranose hydrolase [Marinomonas posidonica]|uniref:Pseudaminic acid biosynthesis-associated protein PseG n=1 Tax=Marinomonas posidonica (strain CECT 7376 / NCIMB 14433 / IVIA-Po-181) TaxID=491952 RepID=F6CZJ9_MARPP|nr:UDP-2,4-diacetamido-2,4,6-trideoxy-beta-L-altropyranose hydrolase [Marinomonas posidonica]AEF55811.1 pseudaminic acid biosynthesis-associated protein PseG [Marinomonas posidonica IVIA-Po-181]